MNNIALIKSTPLGQAFVLALGETKKAIKYLMTLTFPINLILSIQVSLLMSSITALQLN